MSAQSKPSSQQHPSQAQNPHSANVVDVPPGPPSASLAGKLSVNWPNNTKNALTLPIPYNDSFAEQGGDYVADPGPPNYGQHGHVTGSYNRLAAQLRLQVVFGQQNANLELDATVAPDGKTATGISHRLDDMLAVRQGTTTPFTMVKL